jgi:MOSC domain-containing protein YiiM
VPSLLAACIVAELRSDSGYYGVTAIDKRPVAGRVKVHRFGLRADVQADRKHHGGLDQAVYAYSQADADYWQDELGRELPPGWFGENLRVDGLDATAARTGERWRIGEGGVVLEATVPRTPCMTFARWVGGREGAGWVKRFAEEGRLGAYFRVVHAGSIGAGDEITVTPAPAEAPTMIEIFRRAGVEAGATP